MKRFIFLTVFVFFSLVQLSIAGIEDGLVHHWKFEGNLADEVGMSDGTLNGVADYIKGAEGYGLKLLNNAYVGIDDSYFPVGNSERTISFVAQLKGDGTVEPVFTYGSSSKGALLHVFQSKTGLAIDFKGHQWGTSKVYSDWTSIIVVVPNGALQTTEVMIYVNGQRIQEESVKGNSIALNTALSGTAYFGADFSLKSFFNDAVDDVRIYNRAFSGTDVRELYDLYDSIIEKKGEKGWSPVLAIEEDEERRVLKLEDWIGGEGDKPLVTGGSYIGLNGFTNLSGAIDIRGASGIDGISGAPPAHETKDNCIRFQNPDGTWGNWICMGSESSDNIITESITLNVPSKFSKIQDALAYLSDRIIAQSAIVTIQVADGTYNDYETIVINHPNGNQIHILGNTSNKSSCTINFSANAESGLYAINGHTLGLIDGFTFVGKKANDTYGIYVARNSTVVCGGNLTVKEFHSGLYVNTNSFVYAAFIVSINNSKHGIVANNSSSVNAYSSTVSENGEYGVLAHGGSSVYFGNGITKGNGLMGVVANFNGFVNANEALIENNQTCGCCAKWNGMILAPNATVRNNSTDFIPLPNELGSTGGIIQHY